MDRLPGRGDYPDEVETRYFLDMTVLDKRGWGFGLRTGFEKKRQEANVFGFRVLVILLRAGNEPMTAHDSGIFLFLFFLAFGLREIPVASWIISYCSTCILVGYRLYPACIQLPTSLSHVLYSFTFFLVMMAQLMQAAPLHQAS